MSEFASVAAGVPEPAAEPQPYELRVQELEVRYGGVVALSGCSFTASRACTALIGPNGSGKSTLLDVISGVRRPSRGRVSLNSQPLVGAPHARVARGVVRTFQLPQEFGQLSVLENVMLPLELRCSRDPTLGRGVARQGPLADQITSTAWEILDRLGLGEMANAAASTLSGGQRKLLELGRAEGCGPKVLLLDEPFAGVAKPMARIVSARIRELISRGTAVVLVEHDMAHVQALAEEVIVLVSGSVLMVGSFDEVRQSRQVQDAYLGRRIGGSAGD